MSFNEWIKSDLGMIPTQWSIKQVCEFSQVKGGKRLPKGEALLEQETKYPYIRLVDVENNKVNHEKLMYLSEQVQAKISRYIVTQDDICLAIVGNTIGLVFYITNKEEGFNLTENAARITGVDKDVIYPKYLYYYLNDVVGQHQIKAGQVGSAQGKLPIKNINTLKIKVPPLKEQKAIANILSSLDEKIELNNQMNKTLEEMAQTLFKRWFVDFEFPNEDGEPYKSSGGEMVDSELGMIPKGWDVGALDQIAEFLNGLAMQKFRPTEGEDSLPVLKIKELNQGKTDSSSDRCKKSIQENYIINDGDVIFSWSGSLNVKIWCGGQAGLNQHLFKVTSSKYPKWFYYIWIQQYLETFIRIAADKATTMGHIKRQHLSDAKVLIPNKRVLESMNNQFICVINKVIELNIENRTLVNLRDTLLPKLMSGDIRVLDIEN